MKRCAISLLVGIVLVAPGMAAAQMVSSVNAIGAVNVVLNADESKLVALQLIPSGVTGSSFTIEQVMGASVVPDNTVVKLYDPAGSDYLVETYSSGAWLPGSNRIARGQSMWITAPVDVTIQLVGYVPGNSSSTTKLDVVSGMQLMAYPYPAGSEYTNSTFADGVPGDIIIPVNGDGSVANSASPAAWYPGVGWAPSTGEFAVASGWWYRSYSNRTVTFTKPYSYP